MSVIALFGGGYCSAQVIVEQVADRLGYSVASQAVLERAAEKSGLAPEKIARAMLGSRGFLDGITREWEKSLAHIRAALAETLRIDDRIISGPSIHLIPPAISHVLRVELLASQGYRVEQAMAMEKVDEREAKALVERRREEASRWLDQLTAFTGAELPPYDLRIPLPKLSLEEAVELICESVAKAALRPTERSMQAVADFQLAATIGVALVDRKQYSCDVSVEDGVASIVINQKTAKGQLARTVQALRFESAEEEVRQTCAAFEAIKEVRVRPGSGYSRGSRTLLVDDEREYVMTLSERLEMRDIESDVVYDGEAALTYAETDTPDVMVLDLRMPGMHGFEVLKRIKAEHPEVEVIIVTGHGGAKDRAKAFEEGAFDYLEKPVDINHLAERIRAASAKVAQAKGEGSKGAPAVNDDE